MTNNAQPWNFWVNNTQIAAGNWTYNFSNYSTSDAWLWQGTWTHWHNADGTAVTQNFAGTATMDSGLGSGSAGGSITPPTIPRATTANFSGGGTFAAGSPVTINTPRASGSFTHNITWGFGNQSGTVANNVGTSVSWTPDVSMLTQIPNGTSGTGAIYVVTKNGGTTVGQVNTGFTLTAPATAVPTVTAPTITEMNPDVTAVVGANVYVEDKSSLKIDVNATGYQGSTISSKTATLTGKTVSSGTAVTPTASGTVPISSSATDSRGRTKTFSSNITVLAYDLPQTTAFTVNRALTSAGAVDPNGTYMRIDMTATIKSLKVATVEKNAMTIRAFTKARGAATWTPRNVIAVAAGTVSYNTFFVISGVTFPVDQSFDVRVDVEDKLDFAQNISAITTSEVYMHWGPAGIGIGKYRENGALDIQGDTYLNANPATGDKGDLVLPGAIVSDRIPHSGTTAERNLYYGNPPTTVAAQAALANRQVQWFNTDRGWVESYYAVSGTAGLTAVGLQPSIAGNTAGWYPMGPGGPRMMIVTTASQSMVNGNTFTKWDWDHANMHSYSKEGGLTWFYPIATNAGRAAVSTAGRYRATMMMQYPNGSGTGVSTVYTYTSTGATSRAMAFPVPLQAGYGQAISHNLDEVMLMAGGSFGYVGTSGTWTLGGGDSRIGLEWLGPYLVSY